MKSTKLLYSSLCAASILAFAPQAASGQGMPAEARDAIHTLFNQHTNVTRKVTLTKDGYVSVTESKDPKLAEVLRKHVGQMRERLQSGRMVRGWDPAFREMVEHYDDITHRVEQTDTGLKITVRGKTPAAIKVAWNHAKIVSNFAKKGWAEHDVSHPRAVDGAPVAALAAEKATPVCNEKACCLEKGGKAKGQTGEKACCKSGKCDKPEK